MRNWALGDIHFIEVSQSTHMSKKGFDSCKKMGEFIYSLIHSFCCHNLGGYWKKIMLKWLIAEAKRDYEYHFQVTIQINQAS